MRWVFPQLVISTYAPRVSSWLCTNVFSVHQVSAVTFYFIEVWHSISPLGILIVRITHSSFAREAAENAASRLNTTFAGWPWGRGRPSGSLSLGSCFHVSSCRNNDKCLEELNAKKKWSKTNMRTYQEVRASFKHRKPKSEVMGSVYPRQRGLISQ